MALCQFLKLTPENIIHLQRSGNFLGNIQKVCPAGIQIYFLKKNHIGFLRLQKPGDFTQSQPMIDVSNSQCVSCTGTEGPIDARRNFRPECP